MTTATTPLPAAPPGFVAPDEWERGRRLSKDEWRAWRLIYSADRKVTDHEALVSMRAVQYSDGSVEELELFVSHCDDNALNNDQARELASALIEAAAELDRPAA